MTTLHLGRKTLLALVTVALFVAVGSSAMAADNEELPSTDQLLADGLIAQQPPDDPDDQDDEPDEPAFPEQPDEPDDPAAPPPDEPMEPEQPDDPVFQPQEDQEDEPEAVLAEREELAEEFFVRLTPGVWAPWMFGDVAVDDAGAEVDQTIGDAFADFGLGWTGSLQLGFGEFGILTDVFYATTEDDDATTDFDEAELEMQKFGLNASVAWFAQLNEFGEIGPHAGIRYMWVDSELDTVDEDVDETFDATEGWIDPIIGVAGRINPDPDGMLYIPFYADVGGIVVGSDLSWQGKVALGLELHENLGVELGYRHLHVDYEGDDLDYEIMTTGPTLGITGQF